jgi:hypothetical protein
MTIDDTARRLATLQAKHDGDSLSHDDVSWLLDLVAARDAEIATLITHCAYFKQLNGKLQSRDARLEKALKRISEDVSVDCDVPDRDGGGATCCEIAEEALKRS